MLLAFAPWLGNIPMAGLAGGVAAAVKMIDVEHIQLTWQSRTTSRATFLVTFIATLLLPFDCDHSRRRRVVFWRDG